MAHIHHCKDRNLLRECLHWAEIIFADIILGLSINTLSRFNTWAEARFTVAAVH